jgi:hypothetical protein
MSSLVTATEHHDSLTITRLRTGVCRVTGESFVTLYTEDGADIGKGLVEDGLLLVDKKGGRKLASLVRKVAPPRITAANQHPVSYCLHVSWDCCWPHRFQLV